MCAQTNLAVFSIPDFPPSGEALSQLHQASWQKPHNSSSVKVSERQRNIACLSQLSPRGTKTCTSALKLALLNPPVVSPWLACAGHQWQKTLIAPPMSYLWVDTLSSTAGGDYCPNCTEKYIQGTERSGHSSEAAELGTGARDCGSTACCLPEDSISSRSYSQSSRS